MTGAGGPPSARKAIATEATTIATATIGTHRFSFSIARLLAKDISSLLRQTSRGRAVGGQRQQLDVDAGVAIEQFECRTHQVVTEPVTPSHVTVSLNPADSLPNKDFVFRYRVAGDRVKSALVTHRDERGGFFTLMLYPPREIQEMRRQPLELVFVLDCSGSMNGRPLAQAKAAIERGLGLLQRGDSFQLITFSIRASQFGDAPLEATPENVQQALRYLRGVNSEGGTMMIEGIKAALDFPHDPERLRFVCFLTDGFIGNEAEILGAIHERLGPSRIFSFGIGSSVNRYLLDHMAKQGRGAVAYLGLKVSAASHEVFLTSQEINNVR